MAESRSARKHRAIMEAATELFLRDGYRGTSMDAVAKAAAVSKQTVYAHFADKKALFTAIVEGTLERAGGSVRAEISAVREPGDLRELARRYLAAVMRPEVLALRRMIIGEAARQPDLARTYYAQAVESTLAALAETFARLTARGLLNTPDADVAAGHFAFLVLGRPLDRALLDGPEPFTPEQLRAHADAGVHAFLAAYGPPERAPARMGG